LSEIIKESEQRRRRKDTSRGFAAKVGEADEW